MQLSYRIETYHKEHKIIINKPCIREQSLQNTKTRLSSTLLKADLRLCPSRLESRNCNYKTN